MTTFPTRIVAVHDDSRHARDALRRATMLAEQHESALDVLCAGRRPAVQVVGDWLANPGPGPAELARELRDLASPDTLVVAGSGGAAPLRNALLDPRGAEDRTSPVLLVKGTAAEPYRNVLVAVDLGPGSESLLAAARAIAPSARITAVHAYDVPYEGMMQRAGAAMDDIRKRRGEALARAVERIEELAARALGRDHRVLALVERAHPVKLVRDAARSPGADLLLVAHRRRHLLERLLVPSVARQMAGAVPCDVLVPLWLPARREAP